MNVVFAVEPYWRVFSELKGLVNEHWQEIALDKQKIALDPDWEIYAELDRRGEVHMVTARDDGKFVGYHLSFIRPHLHYRESLTCFTDVFFLKKKYRTGMTGYKMLQFFRDSVREKGVQKIYMSTKLSLDLGPLLERLGFAPIERIYTQVF